MFQDLRFAVRTLAKSPGFTSVAVLALALGIGANTAIFTLIRTVLLKPLPYPESDRLVMLNEMFLPDGVGSVSTPNFLDWRKQNRSFDELSAFSIGNANLQSSGTPKRIPSLAATANFFSVLRVQPVLGRTFLANEDQPGAQNAVIISERLWERRFARDPGILGKTLTLDGDGHTVVGVMPSWFRFLPQRP